MQIWTKVMWALIFYLWKKTQQKLLFTFSSPIQLRCKYYWWQDKCKVPPVFWKSCEVVTSLFNYFYHHHQRERSANFYCQSLKALQTFQIIGGILRSRNPLMLAIKSLGMTMMNITSNFDLYLGTSWTDEKDGGDRGGRRTQILTTDKFLGMMNW